MAWESPPDVLYRCFLAIRLASYETHHKSERKDLIKGYIIEAFNEYFEEAKDKKKIIEFVKGQLDSKSPRTRKKAKEFLNKWKLAS